LQAKHDGPAPHGEGRAEAWSEFDDARLVSAVADGSEAAFRVLAGRHVGRIYALARRMLDDPSEAEDVAQDVLARLWREASRIEVPEHGIGAWLRRVAANRCLDYLRRRRPGEPEALDALAVPAVQARTLDRRDLHRRVRSVMAALPERQRLALALFHFEGLSMKETAATLETTPEAIESLLARARRYLKGALAEEWRDLLPEEADRA